MASARIAAGLVLTAAARRQSEIEVDCEVWLESQIAKVQTEPKVEGPFWRRTITHLTQEQARERYKFLVGVPHTCQWWAADLKPSRGLAFAKKAQQLARASLNGGDGFVTLDADEVRILGLPVQA